MGKVSIITPCYNGQTHLEPYIKGLLSQTYQNVEYIFVNDGSNDQTEEIILSFQKRFQEKGWKFKYIKQENAGQAAAINQGLKIMSGEFFCCVDSDDILYPTYIEEMSNCLKQNPNFAICFPWAELCDEKTGNIIRQYKRKIPKRVQDNLFDNLVLETNEIHFAAWMVRTKYFKEIYKNCQIYQGLSGQNAQVILPLIYNYNFGYVEKILYRAIARESSDSNGLSNEDLINKTYSWEDIYLKTLRFIPNMPDYEKAYYFREIKTKWQKIRKNIKTETALNSAKRKKDGQNLNKPTLLETIFSVKNTPNKKHKQITLLGLKFNIKRKKQK